MSYETKNIRNVCLLGHGGSGKTTLAESMLYMTGAIDRQGKTADGNTVCDYDPEEIKRQITISTSIAPVNFGGCKINVLDCPGFFDFAGDVMCALRAVEAGMIFCTAKDGIAVGAERSWKYLKNANMPCMFYVSKTDEDHGDFAGVLSALQEKYGSAVCAVTAPMSDGTGVIDLVHNVAYQTKGNKTTKVAVPAADADMVESLRETLFETAAGADEELMEKYFEDMMLSEEDTVKGLRQGLKDRTVFPVLCGAAGSGIGTEAVLQAIVDYVPDPAEVGEVATADGGKLAIDPNGPVCAFVFKTISDQFGKYSFIKVLSGKVTSDLSLRDVRMSSTDKLGRMYTMCGKKNTEVKEACCGDIVAIGKMEWKTGDTVCDPKNEVELPAIELAEPCYSMAISPKTKGQDDKVASGLARLNEEDISFTLVNNAETHQMVLSGSGDMQIDGIQPRHHNDARQQVTHVKSHVDHAGERARRRARAALEGAAEGFAVFQRPPYLEGADEREKIHEYVEQPVIDVFPQKEKPDDEGDEHRAGNRSFQHPIFPYLRFLLEKLSTALSNSASSKSGQSTSVKYSSAYAA